MIMISVVTNSRSNKENTVEHMVPKLQVTTEKFPITANSGYYEHFKRPK